ncbi:MAG: 4Fe-4S binding protein [Hungatella sp.]
MREDLCISCMRCVEICPKRDGYQQDQIICGRQN